MAVTLPRGQPGPVAAQGEAVAIGRDRRFPAALRPPPHRVRRVPWHERLTSAIGPLRRSDEDVLMMAVWVLIYAAGRRPVRT